MKLDKKGDIGFMEAMAGTMTVCLVMMVFLVFTVAEIVQENQSVPEFDWSYIENVGIGPDGLFITETSDIEVFLENNRLSGISYCLRSGNDSISIEHGNRGGDCFREKKVLTLEDNKKIFPAVLEVILYR